MPVVFNQRPGTYSAWNESRTIHFGTFRTKEEAQKRLEQAELDEALRHRKLTEYKTGRKMRGRKPSQQRNK